MRGEAAADRRRPAPHQGVVHIDVRPIAVRPHKSGLERRIELRHQRLFHKPGQQVRVCRCRRQSRRLRVFCAANLRCRYALQALDLHHRYRQQFFHQGIITSRELVLRLRAHEAHIGLQCRHDMPPEQVQIQPHLRLRRLAQILEEIRRERKCRYTVITPLHHRHRQPLAPLLNHLPALLIRELLLLLHRNNHQRFHLLQRLLHQIPVPQCERIRVHHDYTTPPNTQTPAIIFQPPAILQEDCPRGFGEEAEAKVFEEGAVLRLGEDAEVFALVEGYDMRDEFREKAFAAMVVRHGDTFDSVALDACAGYEAAVIGLDAIPLVHRLQANAARGEEGLRHTSEMRRTHRQ